MAFLFLFITVDLINERHLESLPSFCCLSLIVLFVLFVLFGIVYKNLRSASAPAPEKFLFFSFQLFKMSSFLDTN